MPNAKDFETEVIREIFTTINVHGKFPNTEIKDTVITLLKSLDDDLDAMEYGPSQGSNSTEEALEALTTAVGEYEDKLEEVDDEPEDDDDVELPEEDEPEAEPPTPPTPAPPTT